MTVLVRMKLPAYNFLPRRQVLPAASMSPTCVRVDQSDEILGESDMPVAPLEILDAFAQVPDPWSKHGIRHRLPSLLAVSAAAMIAGSRSYAAIAE